MRMANRFSSVKSESIGLDRNIRKCRCQYRFNSLKLNDLEAWDRPEVVEIDGRHGVAAFRCRGSNQLVGKRNGCTLALTLAASINGE